MSHEPSHSASQSSEAPSPTYPLPVPPHIRTHRRTSRAAAWCALALWAVTYYAGTDSLAREYRSERSAFDRALVVGVRSWTVEQRQSGECIGFIRSSFTAEDKPELKVDGQLVVPMYGHPILVELDLHADFTSYFKLERITGAVRAGDSRLDIKSLPHQPDELEISVAAASNFRRVTLRRPEPIFLVERYAGHFSLRLPRHLQSMIEAQDGQSSVLEKLSGLAVSEADSLSASSCGARLAENPERFDFAGSPLDVGRYLELLKIKPDDEVLSAMRRRKA